MVDLLERYVPPPLLEPETAITVGDLALVLTSERAETSHLWWEELAIDIVGSEYAEKMGIADDVDEYLAMNEREQSFARKIYLTAKEMAEGNDNPVVLLFDVDHTITEEGINNKRVVRPAFPFVIARLREELGERLRIGLLSTLKQDAVRDICLADINPDVVDEQLMISTRQYAEEHPELKIYRDNVNDKRRRKELREILDPFVYAAICAGKLSLTDVRDSDGKLEILGDISRKHPDYNIALADDLPSVGMIRLSHPRIWGISVAREIHDDMYANRRELLPKRLQQAGLANTRIAQAAASSS